MKNALQYLKIYEEIAEESFKKWGYYYPPRNWQELYDWDDKSYEKYLKEKEDDVLKTKSYLTQLHTTDEFGFYLAFQKSYKA